MIINIYMNDLLICGTVRLEINKINDILQAKYHISDLGPVFFYLRIVITQDGVNLIFCF